MTGFGFDLSLFFVAKAYGAFSSLAWRRQKLSTLHPLTPNSSPMVAHVFPSSFLSFMKEILSLISSSVKKGFPVIFLASSSMALSSVVDHSSSPELLPLMAHSKMMALSLDMIHFSTLALSTTMAHSFSMALSIRMVHSADWKLSDDMVHSSCV